MTQRKGTHSDPVAQSLRNEQMRDAAPGPAEREELAREANTCDRCDTHDPETVKMRDEHYKPACSAVQQPPIDPIHVCDDCYDPTTQQEVIDKTKERNDYVVLYECGVVRGFDSDEVTARDPRQADRAPVECRCGAILETIERGDEGDDQ